MNIPSPVGLLVGGSQQPAASGATFPVLNPATGEPIADVADAGPLDAGRAVDVAQEAFERWRDSAPNLRSALLAAIHAEVLARKDEIAGLMTTEMGKSLAEAAGEVEYSASYIRWFEQEAVRFSGSVRTSPDGKSEHVVVRQGVGPTLLITPWNLPLAMLARKVAPALAAGCSAIVKPAEDTPLVALWFARVVEECAQRVGAPSGLVSVLPTMTPGPLVEAILDDARVRKISFTGSTPVGRILLAQAARNVQRTSMELGGNSPFLVFADADLDRAVDAAMLAKFRNIGQSCVGANRFLVHEDLADDFTAALVARVRALRVGDGHEPGVDLGPLINVKQRDRVAALVADAVADGARVLVQGEVPDGPGSFYPPTVLVDVAPTSRIVREEIFGPVATIQTFASVDEGIAMANDTEYGLVAFAMTRDLELTKRLGRDLEAGMIGINRGLVSDAAAPFGGVKQSGLGREGGDEGIEEYLETKYLSL